MRFSTFFMCAILALMSCLAFAQEIAGRNINNAQEQSNLGYMYQYGKGVPQDYAEAFKWYRKAADQGNASAQNNLGNMYLKSEGVSQDYAEALKWYRKAADQGDSSGQFNLGAMYVNGYGTSPDQAEAEKWFRKAVNQGNADAKVYLDQLQAGRVAPKLATLNCLTNAQNGLPREEVISIDYTNLKVNGYKADFYENEIRWSAPSTDGTFNFHNTLNRLSGFINSGSDQFPSLRTGHCAPATKQF